VEGRSSREEGLPDTAVVSGFLVLSRAFANVVLSQGKGGGQTDGRAPGSGAVNARLEGGGLRCARPREQALQDAGLARPGGKAGAQPRGSKSSFRARFIDAARRRLGWKTLAEPGEEPRKSGRPPGEAPASKPREERAQPPTTTGIVVRSLLRAGEKSSRNPKKGTPRAGNVEGRWQQQPLAHTLGVGAGRRPIINFDRARPARGRARPRHARPGFVVRESGPPLGSTEGVLE